MKPAPGSLGEFLMEKVLKDTAMPFDEIQSHCT